MSESIIEFKSVYKNYGNNPAVKDLSFAVEKGSIFGFLGPNGAGKSTTIKLMLGLRKVTKGTVYLFGKQVSDRNPAVLSRIGYVPENESIYSQFTVQQILKTVRGYYSKWDNDLEFSYIEKFELPTNKPIATFSLGMKRKLQLMLALCAKPELLVMDEPTLGLDPITRYKFLQSLVSEVAQSEMTIFLSSHNLSEVERICDTVAFIKKGELIELKKMEDLKRKGQRIKVVFQKEIPADSFNFPGIEILDGSGKHYTFSLSGNIAQAMEEINKFPIFIMEDLDMSLEEIFVEKMEGK